MSIEKVDHTKGFAFAILAYLLWGFLPIYMKALSHVPAAEVVAHRVIWSVPVAMIVLVALLGEKLTQRQWIAILLTVLAVAILTYEVGSLPWLSLILLFSWGFYALFKRSLPIGPNQGFLLEVVLLCPLAIVFLAYLSAMGESHFVSINISTTLLLMGCGLVTAIPLIVYANGAKLLKLSTIAMLQYIAPTLIFLVAVFVFGEEFGWAKKMAFPLIWVALIVFTSSSAKAR